MTDISTREGLTEYRATAFTKPAAVEDTYYKAVRPDGGSFHDPDFRWLPEGWTSGDPIPDGWTVVHPNYSPTSGDADSYLSVATVATDCTGMQWPCVLLEVEPVGGYVRTPNQFVMPSKRAASAWRVVRELPATEALGPQGAVVAALIERVGQLSVDEAKWLGAARRAAVGAARRAAWDAAVALVVSDLISREHYDMLTLPWRTGRRPYPRRRRGGGMMLRPEMLTPSFIIRSSSTWTVEMSFTLGLPVMHEGHLAVAERAVATIFDDGISYAVIITHASDPIYGSGMDPQWRQAIVDAARAALIMHEGVDPVGPSLDDWPTDDLMDLAEALGVVA